MHRQRPSGGSNSTPKMYSTPQNRTSSPYIDPVSGYRNQSSAFNLQRGYGRTPSPQQQLGQRVPDTQSQRTNHLLSTRRPTYAEVVRKQTPLASQYNSARPSGPGSILAENKQPCGPSRRGPATADANPNQDLFSDDSIFAMYTNEVNPEGARETFPYHNSIASGSSVLSTPSGPARGKLKDDDEPWSTVHQRGYEDPVESIMPHLLAMPQMDSSVFTDNHASRGTYLAPPDPWSQWSIQNFNEHIKAKMQDVQPTRPNSGYGQVDHGAAQNSNHRRAPRQVHPNQRASGGTNTRRINTNPVARSGDGRSYPSPSTTSIHPDSLYCPHCDAKFKGNKNGRGNLARHIRHKHKDHPQIYCEYCGQRFQRTDARLKHHRQKHPDLQPPQSNSQKSRQGDMQFQTGPTYEIYSNESHSFNDFETSQDDYPANMGQPDQHLDDLRGLMDL